VAHVLRWAPAVLLRPNILLAIAVAFAAAPGCAWSTTGSTSEALTADAAADAASDAKAADATADSAGDASDAKADASDASTDATLDGGSSDSGNDSGVARAMAMVATPPGVTCMYDAGVAPPGPAVCGDGWRDPKTEQCDDGLGDAGVPRGCSGTCQVLDQLAVSPTSNSGAGLTRTLGRGRHPAAASLSSFAVAYIESGNVAPALSLATFTDKGVPSGVVRGFNGTSSVVADSSPVVAALPCDSYVSAWTDFGGDGDELGIAMRVVQPGSALSTPITFANTTTAFSQFDPDIVVAGGQVVVAWVDDSNASTQPDIRFNTFDSTTMQPSGEQTLAATGDAESDVVLTAFAGAWAAAWRDDVNGLETIRVHGGSTDWTVGPAFLPGPVGSKPAIAQLDATHLLVAYSVGTPPVALAPDGGTSDAGTDGASLAPIMGSKIQLAVVNMAAPGSVIGTDLVATVSSALGVSQSQPSLIATGAGISLAWRTDAALGDPNGEELWLEPIVWNSGALSIVAPEVPLPRTAAHRVGDQRRVGLAVSTLPPGGALLSVWDDLGKTLASGEADGDIAVQLQPLAPSLPNVIFASSRTYTSANLGGLAGADHECQTMAQNANLPGTFLAYLGTSTASASSRFQSARGWVRSDGRPVADTIQQLAAGQLLYPVLLDETGHSFATGGIGLTATKNDGSTDPTNTCSDWTVADPNGSVRAGNPFAGYSAWQAFYTVPCSGNGDTFRLYCLQNTQNVAVAAPQAQGRLAFITRPILNSGWAPSGGLAGADAKCQSDATSAGLPGTYLALLSTSTASAASRFDLTGAPWVRPDGVQVFAQASDLNSFTLASPIVLSADRLSYFGNYYVWNGSTTTTTVGTSASTCGDWTSHTAPDAGPGPAVITVSGATSTLNGIPLWGLTSIGCDFSESLLYCLQK
jgi:hypothetical protein